MSGVHELARALLADAAPGFVWRLATRRRLRGHCGVAFRKSCPPPGDGPRGARLDELSNLLGSTTA